MIIANVLKVPLNPPQIIACISLGSCTCLEESSFSHQGCAITYVILELPDDMDF